ncbi:MAG: FAD-dependent oxidoreductase [Ktedonobacterales bacterium]
MDTLVIGAGVSGLTTGVELLRAGHAVTIWAKALPGSQSPGEPPGTTSEVAAAVWYPYKAHPQDRVNAWGAVTYSVLQRLASLDSPAEHGIIISEVLEVFSGPTPDPWWLRTVQSSFRHAGAEELPPGYGDGYVFQAPVVDMSIYLGYLRNCFTSAGGRIIQRGLSNLDEAFASSLVVVNCTGIGARQLVGDPLVYSSLGQVVRVRKLDNVRPVVVMDDSGPNKVAYIVPRLYDIVLGGIDDEYNENLWPDPRVTADILTRCSNLVPQFAHIQSEDILGEVCGLRPLRPSVRLELEEVAAGHWVVHNYGHGGAGVTLSWGCAAEVVELVGSLPTTGR